MTTEAGAALLATVCSCGGPSPDFEDEHGAWCGYWPMLVRVQATEAQAAAAERERLRLAVEGLPSGWTRTTDQWPGEEWVYRAAVLRLLDLETP